MLVKLAARISHIRESLVLGDSTKNVLNPWTAKHSRNTLRCAIHVTLSFEQCATLFHHNAVANHGFDGEL